MNKKRVFLLFFCLVIISLIGVLSFLRFNQSIRPRGRGTVFLKGRDIWVVDSSGVETFTGFTRAPGTGGTAGFGTLQDILLSPDGQLVAFVNADDGRVWVLDIDSLEARAISSEGSLGQKNCPGTEIFLTGWSPDSEKFLYFIMYQGWDGKGSVEPPTCYNFVPGFHVAELGLGRSYPVQKKWFGDKDLFVDSPKDQKAGDWLSNYFVKWIDAGIVFEQHRIVDRKTYKNGFILVEPETGKSETYSP